MVQPGINPMYDEQEQIDFTRVFKVLDRRKWLIISCLIGVLGSVIALNHLATPVYKADTTIVFEEQKGPAASINPFKISLTKSFITNQIEEIKSRSLSEEVRYELPIAILNTFKLPKNPEPDFNKENYIARVIQKNISASSITNSEVIKIEVEANSPIAAKIIANTVAEVLRKRNLEVRREETSNVRQIIEDQLSTFKNQLDNAEIALKDFKENSNVTVIDKEAEEIFKRITEAEIVYNQAKANLDAANKRLAYIQTKLSDERKELIPQITKITSPWAQKLKRQLVELEVQYTTLKVQDYPEDHPKMQLLKQEIEQTKNNLKKESLKIASGENIVDPITQIEKFMEESISLEIEIQTYQAQEHALKEVIDNYKLSLTTIPNKELRLAQLLRDKDVNENIYMMLLQKREEAKIAEAERVGNIRIIDPAKTPSRPVKPRKLLNLVLGFILGSIMGLGLAFLFEYLDTSIKSIEDAERSMNLNVLGTIPTIRKNTAATSDLIPERRKHSKAAELISRLVTEFNPKSPEAEAFRTLRTNLQFTGIDSPVKTILITSSNPGEGKSLISSNLSITTAQMGLRTLLIDADLRKPIQHILFRKRRQPGFINVICQNSNIREDGTVLTQEFKIREPASIYNANGNSKPSFTKEDQKVLDEIQSGLMHLRFDLDKTISKTNIPNLHLLTGGAIPPNPSEILASKIMKNILIELRKDYDAIFIDTPPINVVTDAAVLGSYVDGTILVIKTGSSRELDARRAKGLLEKSRSKMLGLVINHCESGDGYSKYYHYYSDNNNSKSKSKSKV